MEFVITQLVTGCSIFNCTKLIKSLIQKYIKEKGCVYTFSRRSCTIQRSICCNTLLFCFELEPVLKISVQSLKLRSQLRQYALYASWILLQINRSLNVFLLEVHYNSLKFPAQLVSWDYSRVLRSSSFTKLCHIFFKTYSCETRIWPKHLLPPQTFSCFPKHLSTSDELFGESTNVWATNKMFVLLDPTLDGIELWLSARPISKLPESCCDWSIITAAWRLMSGMLLY